VISLLRPRFPTPTPDPESPPCSPSVQPVARMRCRGCGGCALRSVAVWRLPGMDDGPLRPPEVGSCGVASSPAPPPAARAPADKLGAAALTHRRSDSSNRGRMDRVPARSCPGATMVTPSSLPAAELAPTASSRSTAGSSLLLPAPTSAPAAQDPMS
jgi:hypothetical protein